MGRTAVHPADLAGWDIIMPARREVCDEVMTWLGDVAHQVNVAGSFNLTLNGTKMVRAGLGVRMGFDEDEDADDIRFLPLDPPIETQMLLAWRKGRPLSQAARAFIPHSPRMDANWRRRCRRGTRPSQATPTAHNATRCPTCRRRTRRNTGETNKMTRFQGRCGSGHGPATPSGKYCWSASAIDR